MDPRSEPATTDQLLTAEPRNPDRGLLTLPLVSAAPVPAWHGWTPALPLPAPDSPEPLEPQGAYSTAAPEALLQVPLLPQAGSRPVELLAPAGGPDAAFAAFHF